MSSITLPVPSYAADGSPQEAWTSYFEIEGGVQFYLQAPKDACRDDPAARLEHDKEALAAHDIELLFDADGTPLIETC